MSVHRSSPRSPRTPVKLDQIDLTDAPESIRNALVADGPQKVVPTASTSGPASVRDTGSGGSGGGSLRDNDPTPQQATSTAMSLAMWTSSSKTGDPTGEPMHRSGIPSTSTSQCQLPSATNDPIATRPTPRHPSRAMSENELSQLMLHFFSSD